VLVNLSLFTIFSRSSAFFKVRKILRNFYISDKTI
jgi:hypothetical protein